MKASRLGGRDEPEQGAWGDWTASGGSVSEHNVMGEGGK